MWRKSSYSGPNGNCVEVAETPDLVLVRDSKDPAGPVLEFSTPQWREFVARLMAGEPGRLAGLEPSRSAGGRERACGATAAVPMLASRRDRRRASRHLLRPPDYATAGEFVRSPQAADEEPSVTLNPRPTG